jgi:hypothetical protein
MDASTQVDFQSDEFFELKKRNRELEKLHYNTLWNSGYLSLHDDDDEITDNDELISLRVEFKNLIKQLKTERNKKNESKCCQCIIS